MTPATLATLASINPANGEVVGEVPVTPSAEIPRIVARARKALPSWKKLSLEERMAALLPGGKHLVENADTLGRLLTDEMGKPLREGIGEVKGSGATMKESLEEIAEALRPVELEDDHTESTLYYDPFGVCAAITPWNFPVGMPHWLILPALMAGNTVILKPSEETPLIAQAYVDALNEGLPEGVLQIIHGADDQGKELVAADVDMIAFTGSRETGKKIMASASSGLKRVLLELGGKDPLIVLDDADLPKAARFAAMNSFRNAGQVCVSTERIYVQKKIAPEFEKALIEVTQELRVGPGTEEGVQIGPMINAEQRDHVLGQVEAAKKSGARVVYGDSDHKGNFVTPTILADLNHDMDIMCEETFGPIACIATFDSDDEAVRMANDTPFGLGAAVFGSDVNRAKNVARQLDSAMIGVNKGCGGASGSPWVGAKQSGYGYHSSKDGHRQFAQVRIVSSPKESAKG